MINQNKEKDRQGLLDSGLSNRDLDDEIISLNHPPETIRYTSVFKNIFEIAIPVSLYNLTSTLSFILRTLIITSLSEEQYAFATFSLVETASNFLLSGQSIFNVMEGMLSKECTDEDEGGENVGSILHSAWIMSAIFSVIAVPITFYLSAILRLIGQDKEICDGVSNMATLYSLVIPMKIVLSANRTFLTCTKSKKYMVLFSVHAAGVGLMINFILAKFFLKKSILNAANIGLISEALVALIASTGYILFCDRYKSFLIKKINLKRIIKQLIKLCLSGIPIVLYSILLAAIDMVIVLMYGWCGNDRILLAGAAVQVIYFSSPFFTGINRAACILVGRSLGAKNFANVRRYGNTALGLNLLPVLALMIAYLLIPRQIASLIINPDLFDDSTIRWIFFLTAIKKIATTISFNSIANLEGIMTVFAPSIANILISTCTIVPLSALFGFALKLDLVGINVGCAIGVTLEALNVFIWWLRSSTNSSLKKKVANSSTEQLTSSRELSIFSSSDEAELMEQPDSINPINDPSDKQMHVFL